jgi:hypothetical protein
LSRTFWFPSWISKLVNMSYLATQWIAAQSSRTALQDFLNGEAAEAFVHYENMIRDSVFAELEGGYSEGTDWITVDPYKAQYPQDEEEKTSVVIIGCDVQKGYLVAAVRRFVRPGDSGLIWRGQVADFRALDTLADKHGAEWVFVDQRYRTREVQEWCIGHTGYIPCLGVSRKSRSLFTVQTIDLDEGKRGQGRTGRVIETLHHDPDMAKDILADQIQRAAGARRWMIPQGYAGNAEYISAMTSERNINGKWENLQHRANHDWDAECLALIGAIRLGYFEVTGETEKDGDE